ncbi:MAG TPA: HRDC domain-containing protein [Thermoleophilaceae bacterium]|nr:HRDC domain-containing protein [Thermoleophilaceae bacterium]
MTEEIAERARHDGRLAIDTEFVSERRYQAQLCLVQVAVADAGAPEGVRTDVLDPLDERAMPDFKPLAGALADPEIEVIVHAGRQDVAILRRTWATDVTHVFDTQVAAGFLGFGNQEGYESLVRRALGVTLKGGEGFTRWDKRPLTDKQLGYAADDARCLLTLGQEIENRLRERGRLEWAREECAVVEDSRDERSAERSYERLPKLTRLDAQGRAVARRLCEWRDRLARETDRPPPSVVPDQALVELARRTPASRAALENIRGLPQQILHRRGTELLEEIAAGRNEDPPPPPPHAAKRNPRDAPLVSLAQALVRQRSLDSGIATELIATQGELAALVAALRRSGEGDGVRALHGWRRELIGDELRELIEGRCAVAVEPGGPLSLVSRSP